MAEKVIQHKHCRICERAILVEEEFCSEECRNKWQAILKRRKLTMYFFYGMIAFFIVLILLSGMRG